MNLMVIARNLIKFLYSTFRLTEVNVEKNEENDKTKAIDLSFTLWGSNIVITIAEVRK